MRKKRDFETENAKCWQEKIFADGIEGELYGKN
jgi:hypothetical protein